jgi:hypothetical protein
MRDQLPKLIEDFLDRGGFDWEPDGEGSWYVRMDGENKKGISLILKVGDRTLQVES